MYMAGFTGKPGIFFFFCLGSNWEAQQWPTVSMCVRENIRSIKQQLKLCQNKQDLIKIVFYHHTRLL